MQKVLKAPAIDGIANDACWQNAQIADSFVQTMPRPLEKSKYNTEVKLCYSERSIFVLANIFISQADQLTQLCARDALDNINADIFTIYFDTYSDKQNAFIFQVSSANVQQDARYRNGGGMDADQSWDAVWISATSHDAEKWTAEIEIPFSALRFNNANEQQWRMQLGTVNRKINEVSYWNPVDVNANGFLLQTGELAGITKVQTPIRLALFPYLSGGVTNMPTSNGRKNSWQGAGGMDIRYGINDAFTLDATLVPDYSQVISDNLVRNLGAFEQELQENRPFFTEGTELFNKQGLLYTRRLGSRPSGASAVERNYDDTKFEILSNPNTTQLYNATKISGRTASKLGIGFFNALAKPSYASIKMKSNDSLFTVLTQPLTNYNVLVLDQALKGQSYINFSNASTTRAGDAMQANVAALQAVVYDRAQNYYVKGSIKHSLRWGIGGGAIHGMFANFNTGKNAGKFKYEVIGNYWSKNFNQRDLGLQFEYNNLFISANVNYSENNPKHKKMQFYKIWSSNTIAFNTQPWQQKFAEINAGIFWLWRSMWDISININTKPLGETDFYNLAAYGKKIKNRPYGWIGFDGSSDSRKKLFWSYGGGYSCLYSNTAWTYSELRTGLRYNFSNKFSVGSNFGSTINHGGVGNTFATDNFGQPIVAHRHINEYVFDVNVNYNINPFLSINGRWRHYNNMLYNKHLYNVDNEGEWQNLPLPYTNNLDENFNLQNIDVFVNWIFSPGSRFILNYKQYGFDPYQLVSQMDNTLFQNIGKTIAGNRTHLLSAKAMWYIDYNKLRKSK